MNIREPMIADISEGYVFPSSPLVFSSAWLRL